MILHLILFYADCTLTSLVSPGLELLLCRAASACRVPPSLPPLSWGLRTQQQSPELP